MYYTYVLQSEVDGQFYTGYTKDLKLRFDQHKKGQVESTKGRLPLKLIYYEACLKQEDAIRRERYFKTYNGKRFLHKRLKSYLIGQEASETQTWLEFCHACGYINSNALDSLDQKYEHILAMLNSMEMKADSFCFTSAKEKE